MFTPPPTHDIEYLGIEKMLYYRIVQIDRSLSMYLYVIWGVLVIYRSYIHGCPRSLNHKCSPKRGLARFHQTVRLLLT
jgi:hypothetical protein